MENFIWAVGGFAVGWYIRGAIMRWAIDRIAKQAGLDLQKLINDIDSETEDVRKQTKKVLEQAKQDDLVEVKLEEHHGHFYMFRADNDKFLAQGSTFDEIKNLIKAKHPDITVAAVDTDPEVLKRFKATKA